MSLTRAQLDNPGDLWANIAKTILLADSPAWPFTPYGHRYLGAMANNRTEITAVDLGRSGDHMGIANVNGNSTPYYDHRTIRLGFGIVSKRPDEANVDNHAYCVGRLGYLLSRDGQKFTPAACQNLQVLDIEELSADPSVDEKTDADHTMRHYRIEYRIPESVFAAATT